MWDRQFERYHQFTPYRRTNDETLGTVLERLVTAYGFRHKLHEVKIRARWKEWLGVTIAKYTQQLRLKDKKLYVHINAASLRQELAYAKDRLIARINESLGERVVEEIVVL